ncbi:unannotated protein [freshwater metagenome]|uniref:Unannotated protein n=1 Tax=freshwater metagenome TaxID=449393 RepID=A0A6J7JP82_9ZZZZ
MGKTVARLSISFIIALLLCVIQPVLISSKASASQANNLLSGFWNVYFDGEDLSISWKLEEFAKTTLTLDGLVIHEGEGTGHLFMNDVGTLATGFDFTLTAIQELDADTAEMIASRNGISQAEAIETFTKMSVSRIPFTLKSGQVSQDRANAATGLPSISILRYQTFIPWQYVDQTSPQARVACTPNVFKNYAFNGNNRSFDALSSSFKTRMDTWIYWDQGGSLLSNTSVGATQLFEKVGNSYVLLETQRASDSSMVLSTRYQSNSYVSFNLVQNVMNPFCSTLGGQGIEFDLNVQIWRTGKYALQGWAIRVPSHEAYLKESDSADWHPILKSGFDSFDCLVPDFVNIGFLNCKNTYDLSSQKQ